MKERVKVKVIGKFFNWLFESEMELDNQAESTTEIVKVILARLLTAKHSTIWKSFSSSKGESFSKRLFKRNSKNASIAPKPPPKPNSVPTVKKNALPRR